MGKGQDRVLIIDHDADEMTMLVEAALTPSGYAVQTAGDGASGLTMLQTSPPDVLLLDIHLEGLSGQDVMAALSAQSIDLPVILLANKGAEKEALQTFRLGARDYLIRPVREAELIQAVERALKEVRLRREREHAIIESEEHLRRLRALESVGKSIAALRKLDEVFEQVIRAAHRLTHAESTGFFLKDDATGNLILKAGQNLSEELSGQMGKPISDDLAALVMNSRETYLASGEGLARFQPAQAGATSVIYAPLVVHESAVGLLWVANQKQPFSESMKDLVTALADYAAIAVVNARLFSRMQAHTRELEAAAHARPAAEADDQGGAADKKPGAAVVKKMQASLKDLLFKMDLFKTGQMGRLLASHQAAVDVMYRELEVLASLVDEMAASSDDKPD